MQTKEIYILTFLALPIITSLWVWLFNKPCLFLWQLLIETTAQIQKRYLRKAFPMATPWPAFCPVSRQIQIRISAKISEHEKHKYTFACGYFVVGLPPSLLTARSNDPQPNYFSGEGGGIHTKHKWKQSEQRRLLSLSCAYKRPHLGFFSCF